MNFSKQNILIILDMHSYLYFFLQDLQKIYLGKKKL